MPNTIPKLRTFWFLLRNNFTLRPAYIYFLLRHGLTLVLQNIETKPQFRAAYGDFNWDRECRAHRLMNPRSEGGAILGEVVLFVKQTDVGEGAILLAGDRNDVKDIWRPFFPRARMVTAGVHDMDHAWDYEQDPPEALRGQRFRLIISQATIEHLIDPYKHARDLAGMLDSGGYLVLHSVLPGFFYHRVPIDCMRFYPDWFETVAQRLGLEVVDRQIAVFNITYKFRRPARD
jgi:hypothetical protein